MKRKILRLIIALAFLGLLALPAHADGDHASVVIFSLVGETSSPLITQGMVDALDAWGIVDRADFDAFMREIHSERIEIISEPVERDLTLARGQMQALIDGGHDVFIAQGAVLAQLAANATQGMEDPPAIVFVGVEDPYGAGLAESPCIKLPNVTGSQSVVPYDEVMAILPKLDESIATVGTLYNLSDTEGARGAAQIAEIGEAMGLIVEVSGYTDIATMSTAAEGLITKGAQAIVLPLETGIGQALPSILSPMAVDNNIPVIAPDAALVYSQATVGVGNLNHYLWGINAGRLLVAHLQGELDIASAAISPASLSLSIGVNLSAAASAGIEIPPALIAEADFTLDGFMGHLTEKGKGNTWHVESMRALGEFLQRFTTPETYAFVQGAELPDLRVGQAEFVESVRCAPERIAEEQAALDGAG